MPRSAPPAPSSPPRPTLRRRLARLLGARAPALQVAAMCMDRATGRILMITSRGTGRWIIPKGWPMAGHTLAGAALQEAWEEAGVRARADRDLGIYHYEKMQDHGFAIPIEVQVFLAHVDSLADDYPEAGKRRRQWFTPAEAAGLVAEPELAALILTLATDSPAAPDSAEGSGPGGTSGSASGGGPTGNEGRGGPAGSPATARGSSPAETRHSELPRAETTQSRARDLLSENIPAGGSDPILFGPGVVAAAKPPKRRKGGKSGKSRLAKAAAAGRIIDTPCEIGAALSPRKTSGKKAGKTKAAKSAPQDDAPATAKAKKKRALTKSAARGGLTGLPTAPARAAPGTA